jgi:peptidoglycan/xylan/chitin deacetylase (PgdA/CDA1 family)
MCYDQWIWQHLSERVEVFEQLLKVLRRNGYHTVSLSELYAHMKGEHTCEPRSIVLVFDDGYLDNWVTVYPLLKKYGMKGAVYVNPEFVDPGTEIRPTLEDAGYGEAESKIVSQRGFMNWPELRALDSSGVIDVQSHSMTHTWYFSSPRIVDCYTPQSARKYPWLPWNENRARKPFYLQEDQSQFISWGTPVFEYEKSIITRRFTPDKDAVADVVKAAAIDGKNNLLGADAGLRAYANLISSVIGDVEFPGHLESEQEYEARVRWELAESKSAIEEKLDKKVEFLCWPGGGVNDLAKRVALDVGYCSWTLPGGDSSNKRNVPGEEANEIKRLPAMRDVYFFGKRWGRGSHRLMLLDIMAHQDSLFYNVLRKVYKLSVAAGVAGSK